MTSKPLLPNATLTPEEVARQEIRQRLEPTQSVGLKTRSAGLKASGFGLTASTDYDTDIALLAAATYMDEFSLPDALAASRGVVHAATYVEEYRTNPDLRELSFKSGLVAMNSIELDEFFTNTTSFGPGDLARQLNAASLEQIQEWAMLLRTEQRRLRSDDAWTATVTDLTKEGLTAEHGLEGLAAEASNQVGRLGETDDEGRREVVLAPQSGEEHDAATEAFHFINRTTGLEMTVQKAGSSLVAGFETESGSGEHGRDPTLFIYNVDLDHEIGNTQLDVIVAITQALYGTKHRIVNKPTELPGRQTVFGNVFEWMEDMLGPEARIFDRAVLATRNALDGLELPHELAAVAAVETAKRDAQIAAITHNVRVDSENLAFIAAAGIAGDGGVNLGHVAQGVDVIAGMSPEEIDHKAYELSPSQDEVEAAIEGLEDDRHSLSRVMDSASDAFEWTADKWFRMGQTLTIGGTAFFADLGDAFGVVMGSVGGGNHAQGQESFMSQFDWEEGSAAWRGDLDSAEYFDVPDWAAGGTNLLGQIAGDPLTWTMLGGAARVAHVTKLMSTEAGQLTWIQGQGRQLVSRWTREWARGPLGMAGVTIESGLGPARVLELMGGASMESTMLTAMAEDLWIPAVGSGLKLRSVSANIGRMAGLGGGNMATFLRRYLTQWPSGSSVRLTGGNFFADMQKQMIAISTALDNATGANIYAAAEFSDDLLRLAELSESASVANQINAVNMQHIWTERRALTEQAQQLGHRETWRLADDIPKMQDDIFRAEAAGDAAAATEARNRIPQQLVDEFPQRLESANAWTEAWQANTAAKDAAQTLGTALQVNQSRAAFQAFYEEWWEKILPRLNVPRNANGEVVWSKITGRPADDVVSEGLGPQIAKITGEDGVPILTRPTSLNQPVSAQTLIAWHARNSDSWWRNSMVKMFLAPNTRLTNAGRWMQRIRKIMAGNVLGNFGSYLRSNIEEPIRDMLMRGFGGRTSRVAGVEDVAGAVSRGGSRLAAGPRNIIGAEQPIPTAAAGHVQAPRGPVVNIGDQAVEYVARGRGLIADGAEYEAFADVATTGQAATAKAANHLFSGVFADQPMLQEWAAAKLLGDEAGRAAWVRFWDEGGGHLLVDDVARADGVKTALKAEEAWGGYDRMIETFVAQATESTQPAVRRAIYEAMANGTPIPKTLARQFKLLPAFEVPEGGAFNKMMTVLFGAPGEVHGGLVWQDFYEQSRFILQERHADRILTAERFAAEFEGMTVLEAQGHLWRMSDDAVALAARDGLFLPRQIHSAASRVATEHAEHMAYQMGAASLFGQKAGKPLVFLKAQTDFMGYYYRELMSGTYAGLHPKFRQGLAKLGITSVEPKFIQHLPLNLRLGARMMDYFGTLASFDTDVEEAIRNDRDPLQVIFDRFTFVPTEFDNRMWMQFEPGLFPIPDYALHFLPVTAEEDDPFWKRAGAAARDAISAAYPAFDFFEGQSSLDPFDFENGPGAFQFGDSVASLRRGVDTIISAGAQFVDSNFGTGLTQAWSGMTGAPPGFPTDLRIRGAQAVADNPNMFANADDDDEAYSELNATIIRESFGIAARDGVHDYGRAMLEKAGWNVDREDGQYLELYEPMVTDGMIARLHDLGLIDERQFDDITDLWATYLTVPDPRTQRADEQVRAAREGIGTAAQEALTNTGQEGITRREATRLADELSEVLFGNGNLMQSYLTVKYPLLVGNSVSGSKVTDDAPLEFRDGDGLVVRPGQSGRDLREQGRQELWIVDRDPDEIILAMFRQDGFAKRSLVNELWFQATGLRTFAADLDDYRKTRIGSIDNEPPTPDNPLPGSVLADALGIPPGAYTFTELHTLIKEKHGVALGNTKPYGGATWERKLNGTSFGTQLDELRERVEDAGYETSDPREWSEEHRAEGREILSQAASNPAFPLTQLDYNRFLAPYWGEAGWEVKTPPNLEDVRVGENKPAGTFRMTVDARDLVVLDGDTVAIEYDPVGRLAAQLNQAVAGVTSFTRTSDDAQPIRLLGVNAAEEHKVLIEQGDSSYADQTSALRRLLDQATTVDFVVFDAETFGTFQQKVEGTDRWIMVLYVDGKAVWDESIFTSVNVTGAGLGGDGVTNIPWVNDFLKATS